MAEEIPDYRRRHLIEAARLFMVAHSQLESDGARLEFLARGLEKLALAMLGEKDDA